MSGTSISPTWEDSTDSSFIADYKDDVLPIYARVKGVSKAQAEKIFGGAEFLSRKDQPADEIAFVAPEMKERDLDKKLEELGGEILGKIRVLVLD